MILKHGEQKKTMASIKRNGFNLKVNSCKSENLNIFLFTQRNNVPKVSHYNTSYFVYKHKETMEYVKNEPVLRKMQTSGLNNSISIRIKECKIFKVRLLNESKHVERFPNQH